MYKNSKHDFSLTIANEKSTQKSKDKIRLVYIEDVPKDKKLRDYQGLFCPLCNTPVIPVIPKEKALHYRHPPGGCSLEYKDYLIWYTKKVIQELPSILVPKITYKDLINEINNNHEEIILDNLHKNELDSEAYYDLLVQHRLHLSPIRSLKILEIGEDVFYESETIPLKITSDKIDLYINITGSGRRKPSRTNIFKKSNLNIIEIDITSLYKIKEVYKKDMITFLDDSRNCSWISISKELRTSLINRNTSLIKTISDYISNLHKKHKNAQTSLNEELIVLKCQQKNNQKYLSEVNKKLFKFLVERYKLEISSSLNTDYKSNYTLNELIQEINKLEGIKHSIENPSHKEISIIQQLKELDKEIQLSNYSGSIEFSENFIEILKQKKFL